MVYAAIPIVHVCIGTKAQYIKTVPLLREMDKVGEPYRLIDTGQHASFSEELRRELNVRDPDVRLGGDGDKKTMARAAAWAWGLLALTVRRKHLKESVFGGKEGVCVIHGDTPSSLLAALMAKRAGLQIAHLEAGLTSGSVLNPFPEELIRLAVMRMADILFAPSEDAANTLHQMAVKGEVVKLAANSVVELLNIDEARHIGGTVVITCHRVENLSRRSRVARLVDLAIGISDEYPVQLVLHPPTENAINSGDRVRLAKSGVQLRPLMPHGEFVSVLASALFVITDGGSIQEECAQIGVPTLLWRKRTERRDGLGRNVVLSRLDESVVGRFISNHQDYRHDPIVDTSKPSQAALMVLQAAVKS